MYMYTATGSVVGALIAVVGMIFYALPEYLAGLIFVAGLAIGGGIDVARKR
jgi:hypothetical protein